METIFIELNSPSVSASLSNNSNKTIFLDVENIDLKKLCTIRTLFDIDRPLNDYRLFNTKESIAHYKAHVDAWKYIIDNNLKSAMIIDNTCSSSSSSLLIGNQTRNVTEIPIQGDLFLLEYESLPDVYIEKEKENGDVVDKKWMELRNIFHGLNKYIITYQGARFLLQYAYPIEMRIDSFVGTMAHLFPKEFQVYYLSEKKGIKNKRSERSEIGNREKKIVFLKTSPLEVPFKHNHPKHTRPSSPMSNIPMFIATFLFFGIFLVILGIIFTSFRGQERQE